MQLFWSIASDRLRGHAIIRIVKVLDWQPVVSLLSEVIKSGQQRKGGRTPYNAMNMFRALLLARWYGLSYKQLEDALLVRLDFLVFCGFDPLGKLPDASTLNRFALRLDAMELEASPFDLVQRQMDVKGIELRPVVGALKHPKVRFRDKIIW